MKETVTYEPSSTMPSAKTSFKQDAQITAICSGWQKIKNKIEDASVERFSQNAITGREGFEAVLQMSRRVFEAQRESEARHKL